MKPRIIVDLDSVVVDLMSKWLRTYNARWVDDLTMDRITDWDTSKFVRPECGKRVFDILAEPGFYTDLDPIPAALEALEYLRGYAEIHIATHAVNNIGIAHDKLTWLAKYMPAQVGNIFLGPDKAVLSGDVLIDDGPHNLIGYHREHPRALCIGPEYGYNRDVPRRYPAIRIVGLDNEAPGPSYRISAEAYRRCWQSLLDCVCSFTAIPSHVLISTP